MNYLRKEELQKISGATRRERLIGWLDSIGVQHIPDANGWPVVAESAMAAKLGNTTKPEPRINFA